MGWKSESSAGISEPLEYCVLSKMQILKAEDPSRMLVLSPLLNSSQHNAEGSWVALRSRAASNLQGSAAPVLCSLILAKVHALHHQLYSSLPTPATVQTQTGLGARHPL